MREMVHKKKWPISGQPRGHLSHPGNMHLLRSRSLGLLSTNMAFQLSQQYPTFRAQKSMGLIGGMPTYTPIEGFAVPDNSSSLRAEHTSQHGNGQIRLVYTIEASAKSHFTWFPAVKLEDGAQHKNLRVFSASTGEELISFAQKSQENWDLQYTIFESHAIRLVAQEIQVYRPAEWRKGIVDQLRVEGASMVLVLTQREADNSNKSYYGETGNFDFRVTLDKERPIHAVSWSPNSKEFGVVYRYMPAKTTLFDQRMRTLHYFGSSPRNSFNPQGCLVARETEENMRALKFIKSSTYNFLPDHRRIDEGRWGGADILSCISICLVHCISRLRALNPIHW
ncbi:eukaryotic translation initiation factor eIF2A-domain-containing protein [Suillus paluster]|uniref:eukaryotic translation initiation factor eIF2A-domain-containing protein n=1 Tax=Suillus paluster TaxID=48578 RepID=UPI001B87452D|nr:eukaryotic translation initiation factor eIF2A-domain-containing protein [Suillus paluster]KAG1728716.1 eukaryotic translation initiation factor eIF2A-domain-containing protein [Suillus paluster]